MIYFDKGIVFVHDGVQYVTENEPAYGDFGFPSFHTFAVELPSQEQLSTADSFQVYAVDFVVKMDVLESDKFEWDDKTLEYHRLCPTSDLDFCRDAYLDEPSLFRPVHVYLTPQELMTRLLI